MMTAYETLLKAQSLGIAITAENGHLQLEAPVGKMTLELMRSLKEHKEDILFLLSLPEPAKPGEEVEQLRCKIGEMVREQMGLKSQDDCETYDQIAIK